MAEQADKQADVNEATAPSGATVAMAAGAAYAVAAATAAASPTAAAVDPAAAAAAVAAAYQGAETIGAAIGNTVDVMGQSETPGAVPTAIAIVGALADGPARGLNRYQVAVALNQPVIRVTPVLEQMVDHGVVQASGDVASPNTRAYQLRADSGPAIS